MTTAIVLTGALSVGVIAALAAVFRLAHRLPDRHAAETLHPSQPLPLRVALAHDEQLRRAG